MTDDLDRQSAAMQATLTAVTRRQAFAMARQMAGRSYRRQANWVFAMSLYGLGSTYALAICREMGIDPDATMATPFPESRQGVVGDFHDLMRQATPLKRAV